MHSIDLVSTPSRFQADFPGRPVTGRLAVGCHIIDPTRLSGKLAKFLAETISTTRFDDDASRLFLFTGRSVADDLAKRGLTAQFDPITGRTPPALRSLSAYAAWMEQEAARLLAAAEKVRLAAQTYGEETRWCIETYRWPVFNDTYVDAADYMNRCAAEIRQLGLPFNAGLTRATPDDSLLRSINEAWLRDFQKYRDAQTAPEGR